MTGSDIKNRKKEQRKMLLDARRQLLQSETELKNEAVCRRLCGLTEEICRKRKAGGLTPVVNIFSYAAVSGETDPSLFDSWARERGMTVAYPVSHRGGIMDARVPEEPEDMPEDRFGIRSPKIETSRLLLPEEIDLMIVPCVGFDADQKRLGHGGGFYDRYMEKMRRDALRIMIAYDVQEAESVVTEAHDLIVPVIVTESRVIR